MMGSSSEDEGWVTAAFHGRAPAPRSADAMREPQALHESSGDEDWLAVAVSQRSRRQEDSGAARLAAACPMSGDIVPLDSSAPLNTLAVATPAGASRRKAAAPKKRSGQADKYHKLASAMLGQPASPSTLATSTSLASSVGLPLSHFREGVYAVACSAYDLTRAAVACIVEGMVGAAKLRGDGHGGRVLYQPIAAVRYRKYDGTSVKRMKVETKRQEHAGESKSRDIVKGRHELFVTEASFTMLFRKISSTGETFLACKLSLPTRLQSLTRNKAECIREALRQLSMPYDAMVDQTFFRVIDAFQSDAFAGNLRAERAIQADNPGRQSIGLLCDAHKKATVASLAFELVAPLDSRLIRLALTCQGANLQTIRREMRSILREQLVVIKSGHCSADAERFRLDMYKAHIGGTASHDLYRRHMIGSLWNGDIRKRGVVEHYEKGCCASRAETLRLMCNEGMQCILGRGIAVLQRSNWTGTPEAINSIGLPTHLHGLLPAAYLRAMGGAAASAAGDPSQRQRGLNGDRADQAGDGVNAHERLGGNEVGEPPDQGDDFLLQPELVSVWRENAQERVESTRLWVLGGSFEDDLLLARTMYAPLEKLMLQQLALSGIKWERRQQDDYVKSGRRRYQVEVAHEGLAENAFLQAAAALVFDPSSWAHVYDKSEQKGLTAFVLAARMSAACYELLLVRHRFWPYRTLAAASKPELFEELQNAEDCVLDEFTEGFKRHYKDNLGGKVATAEIIALLASLETDTASTERHHSRNERRNKFRVQTHEQELSEMSAWFASRSCSECRRDVHSTGAPKLKGSSAAPTQKAIRGSRAATSQKRKAGWSWTWRAFQHVQCQGRWMCKELAAELSEKYKRLSAKELEYYKELGQIAVDRKKLSLPAFQQRGPKRRRTTSQSSDIGGPLPGTDCPRLGDASRDGAGALVPFTGATPVHTASIDDDHENIIVCQAKDIRAGGRAREACDVDEDAAMNARILKHSDQVLPHLPADWPLLASGATQPSERSASLEPHPLLVITWSRPAAHFADAVVDNLKQGVAKHSQRWESLHREVRFEDCPKLGKVPVRRRKCHDAQRCICSGPGKALAKRVELFNTALKKPEGVIGKPDWRAQLRSGRVVVHLCWRDLAGGHHDVANAKGNPAPLAAVDGASSKDIWLHVSLMYFQPFRPTFTLLERRPTKDEGNVLCVVPKTKPPEADVLHHLTVWEALGDWVDSGDVKPIVSFYGLVCRDRSLVRMSPHEQRVQQLPIPDIDLDSVAPAKRQAKRRRRERGGRGVPHAFGQGAQGHRGGLDRRGAAADPANGDHDAEAEAEESDGAGTSASSLVEEGRRETERTCREPSIAHGAGVPKLVICRSAGL